MSERWSLRGKRALITGGSAGIGLATASELLGLGADVALVARDRKRLEWRCGQLADAFPSAEIRALAIDLAYPEHLDRVPAWLAEDWASLDILVNNVGTNLRLPALDYTPGDYQRILDTNLVAAFELCRLCHALLIATGSGASIVNVASVAGERHVGTGAPYAMSKAALIQLARSLACEWAADGIRVNTVSPWYIATDLVEPVLSQPEYLAEVLTRTPMSRVGTPEEVAAVIAFLCLPAAGYVTGQCIGVDGGFSAYGFSPPLQAG